MKSRGLTKQELIDWGYDVEEVAAGVYKVYRTVRGNRHEVTFSRTPNGYELTGLRIKGRHVNLYKHRIVFVWYNEDIPENMQVDHINDNKNECKYQNLQLLTQADNLKKMWERRRQQ